MTEWFEEWFGEEYLALYPHRDDADAVRLIGLIRQSIPWVPGWRVLDVACGAGRHAKALADAGARCVGLDLSAALLRRAGAFAAVPLIRADMRQLPVRRASMDVTVNLFTSFGYFETDGEHRDALGQMADTLRPGGWLIMDFLNADLVRNAFVPEEQGSLADQPARITRELMDGGRFVRKTIAMADGRTFHERVRLFAREELREMFASAGVMVEREFGDYAGGPAGTGAPRVVLMGRRA